MKYSKLKKLKEGTKVRISKKYLKFWDKHAESLCARPSGEMSTDDHLAYLLRKAIGLGVPYVCKIIHTSTNEPGGGARVEIFLTPAHSFTSIIPSKEVRACK